MFVISGVVVRGGFGRPAPSPDPDYLDLVIVGAGPAGFSASLAAKALHMRCVTVEQDSLGGCVFQYPRGKVVMTAPAELPLVMDNGFINANLPMAFACRKVNVPAVARREPRRCGGPLGSQIAGSMFPGGGTRPRGIVAARLVVDEILAPRRWRTS